MLIAVLSLGAALPASGLVLHSPGGNIQVTFEAVSGIPTYAADYRGKPALAASRLGFNLQGATAVGHPGGPPLAIDYSATASVVSSWQPLYGQWSRIRDRFNELTVDLRETASPGRLLRVTFRAIPDREPEPAQPHRRSLLDQARRGDAGDLQRRGLRP